MFDDSKNTTSQTGGQNNSSLSSTPPGSPNGNPFETPRKIVEDMFDETDNMPAAPLKQPVMPAPKVLSEKPEIFQPKQPEIAASDPLKEKEEEAKHSMKKIIMLSSFALVLLAIIGGSWYAYAKFFKNGEEAKLLIENQENANKEEPLNKTKETNQNNNINQPVNPAPDTNTPTEQPASPAENAQNATADTDGDGLTDKEEKQLGTNELQTDTDNDGLFDRQEVKVYKTDPKNSDSDGDSYSDGDEVKGGYNPLGAGKLLPPLPQ